MELEKIFETEFNQLPQLRCSAPGRVNIIGEHVDYNEGPVLPMAIDLKVELVASISKEPIVSLFALDLNDREEFNLKVLDSKQNIIGQPIKDWAKYPAGVAWAFKERGFKVPGIKAVYTSSIPIGAGLSSSAAVEVAFALLWDKLACLSLGKMEIAQLCQSAENLYVNLPCGLMDQFASTFGIKENVLFFDTRTLHWESIPIMPEIDIVIIDSGIRHKLVESEYTKRKETCRKAIIKLQKYLTSATSLRDISTVEFAAYGAYLSKTEYKRAEHVIKEIARVYSAANALKRNDIQALGALLYAGHSSLRDLYEVSIPAIDDLIDIARKTVGCVGARLTGAGFGGCTVNIVNKSDSQSFIESVLSEYKKIYHYPAHGYICNASGGATLLEY